MKGFIAHLDYNLFSRNVDLQFAMFLEGCDQPKMVALPFGEGSLLDAMNRVDHVRAAHWHTFWVGPGSAKFPDRKPIIRWLPPIPIGMDWRRELPTNIHIVLES